MYHTCTVVEPQINYKGGIALFLLTAFLYATVVISVVFIGVQEHRGRNKHQWKLIQQLHRLDFYWLSSGKGCEVIYDQLNSTAYATLNLSSEGKARCYHLFVYNLNYLSCPCTSICIAEESLSFVKVRRKNNAAVVNLRFGTFILNLTSVAAIVVAMLLLLAGDVERNPGPPPGNSYDSIYI